MKRILVLGAGMVAGPLVRYLLEQTRFEIVVADQFEEKAEKLVNGHDRGIARGLQAEDAEGMRDEVKASDIVVSLLPWTLHMKVANLCVELGRHLVTASYVKPEMQALDDAVKSKGLLFLNEIGVDPGIDHMAAMKVIDESKSDGGAIESFYSYCGGLPALESNNNPLGYKFSWSPAGAMLAANNDGCYLKNGEVIDVPGKNLFEHYWLKDIPGAGVFEAYVNRNALPYRDLYGIEGVKEIYRGTLRNIGYCETWDYFKKLNLLNQKMKFDFDEVTPRQAVANIINSRGEDLAEEIAAYLKIPAYSLTIKKLKWLGLLSDEKLPIGTASVFDMFAYALKEKLRYLDGECDLLIQHHEFVVSHAEKGRHRITSTLINQGIPCGDTSMARTVGLPVAIAVRMLGEGEIDITGVRIPVLPQIYEPILKELETYDIGFSERRVALGDESKEFGK